MSKTRKMVEQDVQRDEVAEGIQGAVETLKRNRNWLLAGLVVVLLVIVIVSVVRGHQERVIKDSNRIMSEALSNYNQLESQTDPKQRQERLQSVITATGNLIEAYPNSKLAREALYLRGATHYAVDNFAKSQEAYKAYLGQARGNEEKARGEVALAYAFENESFLVKNPKDRNAKLEQAMTHFTNAASFAKGGGDDTHPEYAYLYYYALLGEARLNELTAKNDEAIKIYKKILADRPAPIVVSEKKKDEQESESGAMMSMLRKQLGEQEAQLSFQTTAKLRLERLEAKPAEAAPVAKAATAKP